MVKALDAPYEAGRRGARLAQGEARAHARPRRARRRVGHGRRQRAAVSNLHLGARDPATGGFVMLGKTFKGMTDAMLAWQTERLLELETGRDGHVVHVRPELVVEIAFDGVQASPRYPGGVALRFARVKGYRPDKPPDEADTIDRVRAIHCARRAAFRDRRAWVPPHGGRRRVPERGKVYPDGTRAVGGLDLEIGDGEFMVLVGPSGCGKTTALRMVAGLEEITRGRDPHRRPGRQPRARRATATSRWCSRATRSTRT